MQKSSFEKFNVAARSQLGQNCGRCKHVATVVLLKIPSLILYTVSYVSAYSCSCTIYWKFESTIIAFFLPNATTNLKISNLRNYNLNRTIWNTYYCKLIKIALKQKFQTYRFYFKSIQKLCRNYCRGLTRINSLE